MAQGAWLAWLLPSLDTIDTMTEVQVEELWTRTVKNTPIMRPTTGLLNISFPWNTLPEMECNTNTEADVFATLMQQKVGAVRKSRVVVVSVARRVRKRHEQTFEAGYGRESVTPEA